MLTRSSKKTFFLFHCIQAQLSTACDQQNEEMKMHEGISVKFKSQLGEVNLRSNRYPNRLEAAYFLPLATCFAAFALFFFCVLELDFACFCAACLFVAFGDLSPIRERPLQASRERATDKKPEQQFKVSL